MTKTLKKGAFAANFVSPSQLILQGFESPFSQQLHPGNRWVILAGKIPWDEICNVYSKQAGVILTGRPPISPRVVIGSLIIKLMCNLDDRETIAQITENMYMQYFVGYSSFSPEPPFDASLFVEFRTRMGLEQIHAINGKIHALHQAIVSPKEAPAENMMQQEPGNDQDSGASAIEEAAAPLPSDETEPIAPQTHKGRVLFDATACPQDIAYPTDLGLLSKARQKAEENIDTLYIPAAHGEKPLTYRKTARKDF